MSDSERKRRPAMTRTTPDRSWKGAFAGKSAPVQQDTVPPAEDAAAEAKAGNGLEDAVSRSVEIGYRVIDDYLRQGRDVARTLRDGRATPESLVRDTGDLATRMMHYASDFVGTWLELFELTAASGANGADKDKAQADAASAPQTFAAAEAGAAHRAPETAAPEIPRVDLAVVTRRRVEASLRLDDRTSARLRVHSLRRADASAARIEGVEVIDRERPGTATTIRVTVPDDMPSGAYEGLVLDDEKNLPVGVLRITIPSDA